MLLRPHYWHKGCWRRGFTLIELLVVIAIIAILVALLLPAVQQVREAARKSQCQDHLHNLGVAVHDYESSARMLPPSTTAGNPNTGGCSQGWIAGSGLSWRYKILPFVEQKPLYDQINPATMGHSSCWGGQGIPAAVFQTEIDVYLCPSDPTPANIISSRRGTNYAAAVRARADRSHGERPSTNIANTRDLGAITRAGIKMAEFVDGTSNTVMVGEVFRGKSFWRCNGGSPHVVGSCTSADLTRQRCRDWIDSTGFCQVNAGVVAGATAGGGNPFGYEGRFAINSQENDQVSWSDSVNGGNNGGRPMSSAHPGGAQVCMGDAKVTFVSENVDMIVLAHTFSSNGGEVSTLRGQ